MVATRLIPCLLLNDSSLVKTIKFDKPQYIGDPVNTCRIFNELEADELCILDIRATVERREPNFKLLREIANECFMPLAYGGGIKNLEQAETIFSIGFEKVVLNSCTFRSPEVVRQIVQKFGSQAVVASVDVKRSFFGKYEVFSSSGREKHKVSVLNWISELEQLGVGEILLTSVDREGTWSGFDLDLVATVTEQCSLPVIAHGGAGSVKDVALAVKDGNASAVALGSMVVYQRKGMGVLVNFPGKELRKALS